MVLNLKRAFLLFGFVDDQSREVTAAPATGA